MCYETGGFLGLKTKIITHIIDNVWLYKVAWRVSAYVGANPKEFSDVELKARVGHCEIKTRVDAVPVQNKAEEKRANNVRLCLECSESILLYRCILHEAKKHAAIVGRLIDNLEVVRLIDRWPRK